MDHNPRTIAALTMQRLNEAGQLPTPENFSRLFYELSIKPLPDLGADMANILSTGACQEFVRSIKELVQETEGVTERLAHDLGERNAELKTSNDALQKAPGHDESLKLVAKVIAQACGMQEVVEASRQELAAAHRQMKEMEAQLGDAQRMLGEDALTGTLNRRGLDATLAREVARARRTHGKLSLVMADLDFFKRINDTYGHEGGDRMIVHFANLIREVLRQQDALARYGGEEFVIVLADTDLKGAQLVVHRLQSMMAKSPLAYEGNEIFTTFSAGVAELKADEEGLGLLRRADVALYAAKVAGRNCLRVAP